MREGVKRILTRANQLFLRFLLPVLPFRVHAYLAGIGHGTPKENALLYQLARLLVVGNLGMIRVALSQRLWDLPLGKRRERSLLVWQTPTVMARSERAFQNVEERSLNYAYGAIRELAAELARPLAVLELGGMNGGSLQCLNHLGVPLRRFVVVDISEKMIQNARRRFGGATPGAPLRLSASLTSAPRPRSVSTRSWGSRPPFSWTKNISRGSCRSSARGASPTSWYFTNTA